LSKRNNLGFLTRRQILPGLALPIYHLIPLKASLQ
jgi:hypothetical protein